MYEVPPTLHQGPIPDGSQYKITSYLFCVWSTDKHRYPLHPYQVRSKSKVLVRQWAMQD